MSHARTLLILGLVAAAHPVAPTLALAQAPPTIEIKPSTTLKLDEKSSCPGIRIRPANTNFDGKTLDIPFEVTVGTLNDYTAKEIAVEVNEPEYAFLKESATGKIKVGAGMTQAIGTLTVRKNGFDAPIKVTVRVKYEDSSEPPKSLYSQYAVAWWLVDTQSPAAKTYEVERFPGGSGRIHVTLKECDLDPKAVEAATFELRQLVRVDDEHGPAEATTTVAHIPDPEYDVDERTLTLNYRTLNPGFYTLTITNLADRLGQSNKIEKTLEVPGGRQPGNQVEFPRFLKPGDEKETANPADRVDTRVVPLYYFRDARRVAQIINRNVKNLNQVGYEQDQRFAERGRQEAEEKTDERRYLESLSVQDAQRTRRAESEAQQLREQLAEAQRRTEELTVQNAVIANQVEKLKELEDEEKKKELEFRYGLVKSRNDAELEQLAKTVPSLQSQVNAMPARIQALQEKEIESRNRVQRAESSELRTAQERFRREVVAGLSDPETYVAGKVSSQDPVTQVSITVVGTGRLQLRGPIAGINKIRRMIDQIDSPVGQVKVGIHTVQVNGEHGDRMDLVYEGINREIAHSRFLVNTSMRLFRKAVTQVGNEVASFADDPSSLEQFAQVCPREVLEGRSQEMRDLRYVYLFFGADFVDELRDMDSELLNTRNKLLSINSIDNISLAGALYVTALADHPVRQMILSRYQTLVQTELPAREVEYVRALTRVNVRGNRIRNLSMQKQLECDAKRAAEIYFSADRNYRFPNMITFFNNEQFSRGRLNPVQVATIRLAQVLKAQLVSELKHKNHVLEYSLLEVRPGETEQEEREALKSAEDARDAAERKLNEANKVFAEFMRATRRVNWTAQGQQELEASLALIESRGGRRALGVALARAVRKFQDRLEQADDLEGLEGELELARLSTRIVEHALEALGADGDTQMQLGSAIDTQLTKSLVSGVDDILTVSSRLLAAETQLDAAERNLRASELDYETKRKRMFAKRLLEQFMDEQEEKTVDLKEALRSHASNVDNYLKRLAIAIEDDVSAQFYEPAFQRIRRVSRTYDVTLGQIETTTVLTNNRTLAKVDPAASFEFDLPRRDPLLLEAFEGSKALATEYGNLLQDGTFLAGTSLLAGQPAAGIVGGNAPMQGIPGLPISQGGPPNQFGAELQKLIPDPEIYKFETGTGFEIRPVIQPDGESIAYTFDYMYTTNVREPVRADEKHLGRVKRHFVHTDVQTSSYELREVSRYTVALKASRTARGVPLFEDLPGIGPLFRPLPSDESSLQTNIILASSTVYPTMFDLAGLRWSPHEEAVQSSRLVEEKSNALNRRQELKTYLMQTTRDRVNREIGIPNPQIRPIEIPSGHPPSTVPSPRPPLR